ncbi:MAG: hypothetical protein AB8B59_03045 [Maribacter sp.]
MKKIISSLLFLLVFSGFSQSNISTQEWQEDLRYLQKTVNEQYSFLFKKVKELEFNDAVESFYEAIPTMEQHEIIVGFSRIIALFKYGHTRMAYSDSPVQFHSIPVEFYRFNDGLYIKSAHKDHQNIIGGKVHKIQGVAIDKVMKAVYPTVPVENALFFDAYGLDHMTIPEVLHAQGITEQLELEMTLLLEKDDKEFEYTLKATTDLWPPMHYGEVKPDSDWVNGRDKSQTPLYLKNFDKIYYYEYLAESKTVYVRHSRIQNDKTEDVKDFYNRVFEFIESNDVEKFVMDVRLNGGGNNFLNKPIITGIISNKKINQPGKFFVITGRRTFSAAQSLINELDNYTNVLFVGEPSSENINFYGDNKRVVLPKSGLPVYLSFAWWQDKSQWQNADYIKPHYPVEMNYENYISNEDVVLNAALNFESVNFVMKPMEYLTKLFEQGKFNEVTKEGARMANDPAYSFVDFEREFNSVGSIMMGNNNEGALLVFELAVKVFPESQNTWGNLAQTQWEMGNLEKAKISCKKVLSISDKGGAAFAAKRMLKKIANR